MRARLSQPAALLGGLTLALGLLTTASAQAQAPASYYYPAAGHYATTAGTVYIPAPGYYYNIPANAAVPRYYTGAVRYGPSVRPGFATRPSRPWRSYTASPPYYSSAIHSQHARGHNTAEHGR